MPYGTQHAQRPYYRSTDQLGTVVSSRSPVRGPSTGGRRIGPLATIAHVDRGRSLRRGCSRLASICTVRTERRDGLADRRKEVLHADAFEQATSDKALAQVRSCPGHDDFDVGSIKFVERKRTRLNSS